MTPRTSTRPIRGTTPAAWRRSGPGSSRRWRSTGSRRLGRRRGTASGAGSTFRPGSGGRCRGWRSSTFASTAAIRSRARSSMRSAGSRTAAAGRSCSRTGAARPRACSTCGSVDLAQIGAGTARVESELGRRFPRIEVVRMDADVAARDGEPEATLRRFRRAEAAVLVGTQLVAKGHDVPGVVLAAVIDADLALAVPDFRAEERAFALYTQLAGRPGR